VEEVEGDTGIDEAAVASARWTREMSWWIGEGTLLSMMKFAIWLGGGSGKRLY
jgi:hypothetical protein